MGRMLGGMALALALVAPAQATVTQPPSLGVKAFTLTADPNAHKPNVAVDDMGVGHFFWDVNNNDVNNNGGDDPAVYCRVPRGATACATTQTFNLPLEAFGEPQVLAPAPGEVILITHRCCGKGEGTYAIVSTDGGNTFSAPAVIGTIEPGQAAYGPGTGVVSLVDDVVSGGVSYQAASLDGYTENKANVGNGPNLQGYDGTVGFPAANIPIVAFDDLTNGFYRLWGGAGDPNDLSTWGPQQSLGPLTELRMATGFKGVVLMGKQQVPGGQEGEDEFVARRFDPTTSSFGTPVVLSDPKIETDNIFRDINEDSGGNIAAVWIANGLYGKQSDPIRYRASVDGGKTWQAERTLVYANDSGFNLQLGAGSDGGGWLVYDDNDQGPVTAVPIPPLSAQSAGGGSGAACAPSVSFGQVQALALSGCLAKQKDGTYTSADPVRLNGLDLEPHAGGKITIDPVHKTVKIAGADVRAGDIVLDKGSFDWDLSGGAVATFSHLEKFGVTIFGFPVTGTAQLTLTKDGATIPAHVELPSIFGGVTGDITLSLHNPGGLKLDGLHIHIGDAFLGALEVKNLDVDYKGSQPPVFEGSATFLLPPTFSEPGVHVGFGFVDGKFKHAEGSFPLQLPLFPPWLYLQQIGLAMSTEPLTISGGVALSGGPKILGTDALEIDALPADGGGFTASLGDPAVFRVAGKMKVVGLQFASGFIQYSTSGLVTFGGGLDFTAPLNAARLTAGIPTDPPLGPGFLDLTNGNFNFPLSGDVCIPGGCGFIDVGGQGVVSTVGWAVCGQFRVSPPLTPDVEVSVGLGEHWGDTPDVIGDFGGCDVSDYAATARRRGASSATVNVPAGLPQENIVVAGTGGAPKITVTAPGGETLSSSDSAIARSAHMAIVPNAAENKTLVFIGAPAAGAYTIATQAGSAPIASVKHADGLPEPKVTGTVGGHGYARRLVYKITPISGQTVSFFERSTKAAGAIGNAKGNTGVLRFTPANGPAGKREIVAQVVQNGIPRRNIVVATYTAPGPRRPGRPRFARVARAGGGIRVTWGAAARAARYLVHLRLHDGTNHIYILSRSKRSVGIKGVTASTFGSVTVAGLTATSNRPGPAARATVKKRKRAKHRHRR